MPGLKVVDRVSSKIFVTPRATLPSFIQFKILKTRGQSKSFRELKCSGFLKNDRATATAKWCVEYGMGLARSRVQHPELLQGSPNHTECLHERW